MGDTAPSTPKQDENAPSRLVAAVRALAAPRERTVDDHMFRIPSGSTCRLQLFTAPGVRPVAVATQRHDEGVALTNAVEGFAAHTWKRYCHDEEQPPVFIQRQLQGNRDLLLPRLQHETFELVTFEKARPYQVQGPGWQILTEEQMQELVGQPVATDRGSGYTPRPPEPEPVAFFEMVPLSELPTPSTFRAPNCMPNGRSPQTGRLLPQRAGRGCCWYHGGDWHHVNTMAQQVLDRARKADIALEDMEAVARQLAQELGAPEWETTALCSLFSLGWPIVADADDYTNGNHRVRGMLDSGVPRTVVLQRVFPDSAV